MKRISCEGSCQLNISGKYSHFAVGISASLNGAESYVSKQSATILRPPTSQPPFKRQTRIKTGPAQHTVQTTKLCSFVAPSHSTTSALAANSNSMVFPFLRPSSSVACSMMSWLGLLMSPAKTRIMLCLRDAM